MSADEAAERPPPPSPAKKKAKKRKKRAAASGSTGGAPAHWPEFARRFPRDPALDDLVDAFEAGNYAAVRERAPKLVHATESDEVRRAARELLKRLEPDPLAKLFLATGTLLLAALAIWYWLHPRGAP